MLTDVFGLADNLMLKIYPPAVIAYQHSRMASGTLVHSLGHGAAIDVPGRARDGSIDRLTIHVTLWDTNITMDVPDVNHTI